MDPERRIGERGDYVLSPCGKMESEEIVALMPKFTDAVELWLRDGIVAAMNAHNGNTC